MNSQKSYIAFKACFKDGESKACFAALDARAEKLEVYHAEMKENGKARLDAATNEIIQSIRKAKYDAHISAAMQRIMGAF